MVSNLRSILHLKQNQQEIAARSPSPPKELPPKQSICGLIMEER
jgi:hypothetical protein